MTPPGTDVNLCCSCCHAPSCKLSSPLNTPVTIATSKYCSQIKSHRCRFSRRLCHLALPPCTLRNHQHCCKRSLTTMAMLDNNPCCSCVPLVSILIRRPSPIPHWMAAMGMGVKGRRPFTWNLLCLGRGGRRATAMDAVCRWLQFRSSGQSCC